MQGTGIDAAASCSAQAGIVQAGTVQPNTLRPDIDQGKGRGRLGLGIQVRRAAI
ncbi:hypothetical protein GCM10007242_05120 [Pigmentiphaga litoralis]|nr:hypothetical protein GCM10007242_05120 [Pigmentiphaga litoralis]